MSAWDDLEEKLKKKQAEGGIWLKLQNDKEKVAVVFLGEPVERETCFVDSKPVPIAEARARKLKIDTKIMFNVMILATKEVKVWEKGPQFYKDLMVVRHKYGLDKWAFEIQRVGKPKDAKTTYPILPERQLSPEEIAEYRRLPLHDLRKLASGESLDSSPAITEDEFPYGANAPL